MSNLMLGLSTALIGMLVVFFGLIVLIFCIKLLTAITGRAGKKKTALPETGSSQPVATSETQEVLPTEDSGSIAAAITAAISCMMAEEKNPNGFVVRRIRRYGVRS